MKTTQKYTGIGMAVASMLLTSGLPTTLRAQNGSAPAAGMTVLTCQSRIYINPGPVTQVVVAFYFTDVAGLPGPLFSGDPSESTAYFTASFDNTGAKIINNGDVSTAVFNPGRSFNIYFNPAPNRTWDDPAGFATGQLVATYKSSMGTSPSSGPSGGVTQSYILASSSDFVFQGKPYNFKNLIPNGFTNGNAAAGSMNQGPSSGFPLSFAGAGSFVSIGGVLSGLNL